MQDMFNKAKATITGEPEPDELSLENLTQGACPKVRRNDRLFRRFLFDDLMNRFNHTNIFIFSLHSNNV